MIEMTAYLRHRIHFFTLKVRAICKRSLAVRWPNTPMIVFSSVPKPLKQQGRPREEGRTRGEVVKETQSHGFRNGRKHNESKDNDMKGRRRMKRKERYRQPSTANNTSNNNKKKNDNNNIVNNNTTTRTNILHCLAKSSSIFLSIEAWCWRHGRVEHGLIISKNEEEIRTQPESE
jgi:hypothetical protein